MSGGAGSSGRKRPRLGLIAFPASDVAALERCCPTVWAAATPRQLWSLVSPAELDLVASVGQFPSEAFSTVHSVVFGADAGVYSLDNIWIRTNQVSSLEEYICPPVAPDLLALQTMLSTWIDSHPRKARNLPFILPLGPPHLGPQVSAALAQAVQRFRDAAMILSKSGEVLATLPFESGFLRAFFPCAHGESFDRVRALRLLMDFLQVKDPDRFPSSAPWHESPRWLTRHERDVRTAIDVFENDRRRQLDKLDRRRRELDDMLAATQGAASNGERRLLTAQSDELVAAVREAFEAFGFLVEDCDSRAVGKDEPKGEDLQLRLQDESASPPWVAMVEAKGEPIRSAGMDHIYQLMKHANWFTKREGREPSKLILVSNGAFGLPPDDRPRPFAGAEEQISGFTDDGHLVIPTTDLFEMRRDLGTKLTQAQARDLILRTSGVLKYEAGADGVEMNRPSSQAPPAPEDPKANVEA